MSSNFPNGFKGGVTIRGIPLQLLNPGEVFWVNNSGVLAKGIVARSVLSLMLLRNVRLVVVMLSRLCPDMQRTSLQLILQ